jgi:hypothetical protein
LLSLSTATATVWNLALAGKGRGVFTTAAVAAGDLLMVAQPLALQYCEEGTTPENEELAAALSAAVAATTTAAAAGAQSASSSSSAAGLSLWQQHALLQLKPAGEGQDVAAVEQQLLQQMLGDPADVLVASQTTANNSSSGSESNSESSGNEGSVQQQESAALPAVTATLPGADRVLQIVHANCTGKSAMRFFRLSVHMIGKALQARALHCVHAQRLPCGGPPLTWGCFGGAVHMP